MGTAQSFILTTEAYRKRRFKTNKQTTHPTCQPFHWLPVNPKFSRIHSRSSSNTLQLERSWCQRHLEAVLKFSRSLILRPCNHHFNAQHTSKNPEGLCLGQDICCFIMHPKNHGGGVPWGMRNPAKPKSQLEQSRLGTSPPDSVRGNT